MFEINCPSCGCPVRFRRESSVYAKCPACDTITVRHDVNIEAIGKISDLQPDGTPLCIGTTGEYQGKHFEIIGRTQAKHGCGFWNEWFVEFSDGSEGWIGEALGEYMFTQQVDIGTIKLPGYKELKVGSYLSLNGQRFVVSNRGHSRIVSCEGELPALTTLDSLAGEYGRQTVSGPTEGYDYPYVDLRSANGQAASIDYSSGLDKPELYMGLYVEFQDLHFKGLRDPEDALERRSAQFAKAFRCPSCGAPHELSGGVRTKMLACAHCGCISDLSNPQLNNIYKSQNAKKAIVLAIPLGTKGTVDGIEWECTGFQRRYMKYEGVKYYWDEYIFYNRYSGYRYLTVSNGHWSWVKTLHHVPTQLARNFGYPASNLLNQDDVMLDNEVYRHFQNYRGYVEYVLGEFSYQISIPGEVRLSDFVKPPYILSGEQDQEGVYWSLGEYWSIDKVKETFPVPQGKPSFFPPQTGIAANQPYSNEFSYYVKRWAICLAVCFLMFVAAFMRSDTLISGYQFDLGKTSSTGVVTKEFTVEGFLPTSVNLEFKTNLSNQWTLLNIALLDEKGQVKERASKAIRYYSGSDYYEGDRNAELSLSCVRPGKYKLQIKPELGGDEPSAANKKAPKKVNNSRCTLNVDQGPVLWICIMYLFCFLGFTLLWPIAAGIKKTSFESQRWAESDHATSDSDDDD